MCFLNFCVSGMFSVEVTKSGIPKQFSVHASKPLGDSLRTSEAMSLIDGTDCFDLIALRIVIQ